jgi:hypothetical protein
LQFLDQQEYEGRDRNRELLARTERSVPDHVRETRGQRNKHSIKDSTTAAPTNSGFGIGPIER